MEQKAIGFQRIITGDELWFFLYYPRDSVWAGTRDELPQRIKQKINAEKCLASILWSVNGIHSLLDVPRATMHNITFFTDAVMPSLIENVQPWTRGKTLKGWLIHIANAPPCNSGRAQRCIEAPRAERLPHPAYSPDLAPSNFILVGYIKVKSSDYGGGSREDLLKVITEIFTGVDPDVLLSVFESRVNRVKWASQARGDVLH
jgi:hypothetical protein